MTSLLRTALFALLCCLGFASLLVPVFAASFGAHLAAGAWVGRADPSFDLVWNLLTLAVGLPAFAAWLWGVGTLVLRASDSPFFGAPAEA